VDRPLPGDSMPVKGNAPTADAHPTAVALPAAPPEVPTAEAATESSTVEGEEVFNSDPISVA
jgi:hypothetical protein